jgi:hypothetical protein
LNVPSIFLANGQEILFWEWEREAYPRPVKTFFKQADLERRFATLQVQLDPFAVRSTASAFPPRVRVIVTKPLRSRPFRLVLRLPQGLHQVPVISAHGALGALGLGEQPGQDTALQTG